MKNPRPIAIDLFSGAGGLSLGMEAAGFDVAISVEIDPIHSAIHKYNFPLCETVCRSICEISSKEFWQILDNRRIDSVDLLGGGPPCQGFSQIGYRQIDDPRNWLVFEYLRVVRDLKPKYFIFENVPGIVAGKHKKFMDELCNEFRKIGYQTLKPASILNAADFGVAQNRSRFILLGWRSDMLKPVYPDSLFNKSKKSNRHESLPSLPEWLGVYEVLKDLERVPVFIHRDGGINPDKLDYSDIRCDFSFDPKGAFSLCHRRTFTDPLVYGHLGSQHTEQSINKFKKAVQGETEPTSRLFKLHPHRPANTLRAGTDSKRGAYTAPRPIHYSQPRCISIREAARLHSFPDWFQFHRTIWHGHREIGNAVAPLFAKRIAEIIVPLLGFDPKEIPTYKLPKADLKLLAMTMQQACDLFGVTRDVIGTRHRTGITLTPDPSPFQGEGR